MPRKKTPPAAVPDAILPQDLLEKLIPGPMDAAGVEAVFQKLKKAVIERALAAEKSGPPIRTAMPVMLRPSATRLRRVGRAPSRGQASIIAQIGIE